MAPYNHVLYVQFLKVKAEVAARRERVATALARAAEADRENTTILGRARCAEAEVSMPI